MRIVEFYVRSMDSQLYGGWVARAAAMGLKVSSGSKPFGREACVVRWKMSSDDAVRMLIDPHNGRSETIPDPTVDQMVILCKLVQVGIVHSVGGIA